MIMLILVGFVIIIFLEVPQLLKAQMWKELIAFTVLLAVGAGLSIPLTLGKNLPTPLKVI